MRLGNVLCEVQPALQSQGYYDTRVRACMRACEWVFMVARVWTHARASQRSTSSVIPWSSPTLTF